MGKTKVLKIPLSVCNPAGILRMTNSIRKNTKEQSNSDNQFAFFES